MARTALKETNGRPYVKAAAEMIVDNATDRISVGGVE